MEILSVRLNLSDVLTLRLLKNRVRLVSSKVKGNEDGFTVEILQRNDTVTVFTKFQLNVGIVNARPFRTLI